MRSERSEVKAKGGHDQALAGLRRESARKSALRRLTLESLEERTLLATLPGSLLAPIPQSTLPAPLVVPNSQINVSSSRGDESSPSIAVDKNNPQKMVAVWTRNDPDLGAPTRVIVEGVYSNNGGQTWFSLPGFGNVLTDPTTSATDPTDYPQVTDASVAFDRNDNFYVLTSQHQASTGPNSPNALVLDGYNFSTNTATRVLANKVVYQSTQDMALTPMLAVDDNLREYTDTDAFDQPYTQSDPYSGNIYVAWATNDQPHQNAVNFNANRILMVASSDGGANFSGPIVINTNGNNGGTGSQRATSPQLAISQGAPGVPGGQVTIVYDDFNSQITSSPPRDVIRSVWTGGAAAQSFSGTAGGVAAGANNYSATVQITNPNFNVLSDLSVSVTLSHSAVNDLRIELIGPDGTSILLTPNGGSAAGGASGANLGISANGVQAATIFTDSGVSARRIGNANSTAPYMGYYRPAGGDLNSVFAGKQLNGTWTLRITNNGTTAGNLVRWGLNFNSGMTRNGSSVVASTLVRGALTAPYPLGAAVTNRGIGPGLSIASDNTIGAFSPHQGRIYVAYTDRVDNSLNPADNTDIFLRYSDDGGRTWSFGRRVNDDVSVQDGYSEGSSPLTGTTTGRPQFQPQVRVDDTTGSVVLSWLDARHDAARARVTTYIAASSDGGQSFAPQVYANRSQTAVDAITGETVILGPIPDNQSSGNPNTDGTFGFGTHQGLAVYGGRIYPIWASNENSVNDLDGLERLNIRMATALIAAGPRIIDSTMGAVGLVGDTLNPQSPNGTPTVKSFEVTFDRPIDRKTFLSDLVTIFFRDTTTDNTFGEIIQAPQIQIEYLSLTRFRISFAPRSRVGTYSYYIKPRVQDQIRNPSAATPELQRGNYMDQNANGQGREEGGGLGDVYAAPNPKNPISSWNPNTSTTFIPGPYDQDSLPLVLTGPRVLRSQVPGAPVTADNLVLNESVSAIDVTFDRDMDSTSITPASILRIMGPGGEIKGQFTVAPVPGSLRTYRISFPPQKLNGTYTVTLASSIKSAVGDPLDTNLNAGVALLKQTPTSTTIPLTFPSAPAQNQITIAPQQTINSTIEVPENFLGLGITLSLNINHSFDPDLEASLIGPDGTIVKLFTNVGTTGTQANFSNTTFDDTATTLIQNGGPPFFGRFVPQQPLSAFNDLNVTGTWTLQIKNNAPLNSGRVGTFGNWALSFRKSIQDSGMGELVADQATVSFRIFTTDPTDALAHNTWTSVGPASTTHDTLETGYSGQIGGIAVDPSDPSGNTVFVAGSSGGIWKTTNFLTTSPQGPTYIPLTDFGPTFGMNIGSIAVFGRNNDPNQSIVIAGTGFADGRSGNGNTIGGNTSRGVGFLRSMDGGATWTLLDSTNNTIAYPQRDHLFAQAGTGEGTSTYKVVVDPKPTVEGNVIVYAALSGTNGGFWRSLDTGLTWQKLSVDATHGTTATDISLNLNSAIPNAVSNPTGNVNVLNVAFQGRGVYISPNRGQTLNQMVGNGFSPLIRDPDFLPPSPISVGAGTFPGNPGRIVLARPDPLVPNPRDPQNILYEGWLYAAVAAQDGNFLGLYLTKDNGTTWTQLQTNYRPVDGLKAARPSNDTGLSDYTSTTSGGLPNSSNYNIALTIDPTNPNIVYLGGTSVGQESGLLRIDSTNVFDSHAAVAYDGSRPDGGLLQIRTAGRAQVKRVLDGTPVLGTIYGNFLFTDRTQYINLLSDPLQPFQTNTTLYLGNVNSQASGGTGFTNDGSGVTWIPFDRLLANGPNDDIPSTGLHRVVSIIDPLTGHARLIFGNDQGIFTGVDHDGSISLGIGTQESPTYSRNGNLAISQYFYGAAQPSNIAAQVAQALAYGNGVHTGIGTSDPDVLNSGNLAWTAPSEDPLKNFMIGETSGVGVQTDQQNRGIVYQYLFPGLGGNFTDFFQVSFNGGPFISRTTGLVQAGGGRDPQWTDGTRYGSNGLTQGNFAVNPINGDQVIISSDAGRVFATINQGNSWLVIAEPGSLDGSYAPALAFGAPDPTSPGGIGNLNNFVYAGTVNGNIFVTQTGGGTIGGGNAWTNISTGLDGSPVRKIITNPTRGNHEAYAVTEGGVFHTANSLASGAGPVWTRITGNLFTILNPAFDDSSLSNTLGTSLTSIVADWRYVIPDNPNVANSPTHPVLYVSANSGVYRSLDNGQTWVVYPNVIFDEAPRDGGMLPNVHITDLNLSIGVIDPTTGRAVANPGDPNNLFATTFGRGTFSIRLAPIVFPNSAQQPNNIQLDPSIAAGTNPAGIPRVTPTTSRPLINGFSEQSAFGNTVLITFRDVTDTLNPKIIGGFDPSVPGTNNPANRTDSFGKFSIQVNQSAFTANGIKTIEIQATDASGTKGNITTFQFELQASNLGLPTPPLQPTIRLSPFDDSSNGLLITNVTQPRILGLTDPNVTVELFRSVGGNPTGAAVVTGKSDATGNFSLQFPALLPDAGYTVQVKATNDFGSTVSLASSFTIDTQGPTTATNLAILAADDTGIVGDGITSRRRPRFVGTTERDAIVVLYNANNLNVPLGQAKADSNGNYAIQLPSDLKNGNITVVARARDVAGNQGPLGSPLAVKIRTVTGDYDGDGKADLSLFLRASEAQWLIQGVTSGTPFGVGTFDLPVQGDFNGDGRTDLATYRPTTARWSAQGVFSDVQYGQGLVDLPAPADYFGTGVTTIATFRPTTGEWFIPNAPGPIPHFGGPGDIPVPGDYLGHGTAQLAVYRPSTGEYFIGGLGQGIKVGTPGQIPVPGAYDNSLTSQRIEMAVYDPATGVMTIVGPNEQTRTLQFSRGSIPVPGDYDGVGSDQPAAFDPVTGTWTIYASGTTQARTVSFGAGAGGSVAVAAPYNYRKLPVAGDFTGVGVAQHSLFRRSTPQAQWFIDGMSGPDGIRFGSGNPDTPLLGDFNGDGRADLAVYRPSTSQWFVQGVLPAGGVQFGAANLDIPTPADYHGNGAATLSVYRPTTGEWFIAGDGNPIQLGTKGGTPVPADYDGDGKADVAVFEPANGSHPTRWTIRGTASGMQTHLYGGANDIPVPGAYDGLGKAQLAVFRPGSALWFIGGHAQPIQFGGPKDIPAPADYDGDGKVDLAVYRPQTGQLFIGGRAPIQYGGPNDIPLNAPLVYRALNNKISAASVPNTFDFGGQAAALSSAKAAAPPVTVSPAVAVPNPPATPPNPTPVPATPPVAHHGRQRPNQQNGQKNTVKTPVNRLRAAQLHDSALASILGRLGRLGKRRS